jgi:hypothetical protein
MARPRKPTAELELKGAFAKNPKRRRVDPQTSGPIGDPPPSMELELHATWHELADQAPLNVLRSADRALLEVATILLFTIRRTSRAALEPAMIGQLLKCLSAMGMTPVDRSKVHAPQEKVDNPFAKYASKAAEARKPVH